MAVYVIKQQLLSKLEKNTFNNLYKNMQIHTLWEHGRVINDTIWVCLQENFIINKDIESVTLQMILTDLWLYR